jgi:GNAT superfamily N-acetyltransferase
MLVGYEWVYVMVNFFKFNDSFREVVVREGAKRIVVRLIKPSDKVLLEQGFNSLSDESRLRRFMGDKRSISPQELAYFTELDQMNHFALGMVLLDESGNEADGVAIGRFIRLDSDPETAEVALTVADSMQEQGFGRLLLERLMAAALERGIKRFRFEFLPYNHGMKHLVMRVCDEVAFSQEAGVMIAEASLSSRPLDSPFHNPLELMDSLARQMQHFISEVFKYQTDVGLDLMRKSLNLNLRIQVKLKP